MGAGGADDEKANNGIKPPQQNVVLTGNPSKQTRWRDCCERYGNKMEKSNDKRNRHYEGHKAKKKWCCANWVENGNRNGAGTII